MLITTQFKREDPDRKAITDKLGRAIAERIELDELEKNGKPTGTLEANIYLFSIEEVLRITAIAKELAFPTKLTDTLSLLSELNDMLYKVEIL